MGFEHFGGFLSGFNSETSSIRKANEDRAAKEAERDNKLFDALANSDDPEIRAAAVTGLLTGNHPSGWFNKFMGKTAEHPAYAQIRQLVANDPKGNEPFVGATETKRRDAEASASGSASGRIGGFAQGYSNATGTWPDQETIERASLGYANAGRQGGTGAERRGVVDILEEDGTRRPSVAVVSQGGILYEQIEDGQLIPISGSATNWRTSAPSPNAGGRAAGGAPITRWVPGVVADTGQFPGERSPGGWRIGVDAEGNKVHMPAQPPPAPVPTIVPTPNGNVGVGRGGAEVQLPPNAQGGRAVPPTDDLSAARAVLTTIRQQVPDAKGNFGLPATAVQIEAVKKQRDELARTMGFPGGMQELEQRIGAAAQNVGGMTPQATQPPPSAPNSVTPSRPPRGGTGGTAPPAKQPATGAGGMPPAGSDPNDPAGILKFLPR